MKENYTRYFLNVRVDNVTSDVALRKVENFVTNGRTEKGARQVFFTNVHSIHLSRTDHELQSVINNADMVLPDGSGLKIAGKMLGQPILENLNGTDFTPRVCQMAEKQGWSVYLLGAREETVARCYRNLQTRFPKLQLKGYHNGYFSKHEEKAIVDRINECKPDILFIALGSPLQEKWIAQHASDLEVRVCFAVGGLFDFISEDINRAPLWMRKAGFEWLFRFVQDPLNKWERIFIEIPVFLSLLFTKKQKLISKEARPSLD